MIRILISTLLGAALLFAWGFASWEVLTWHGDDFRNLPNNEANVAYLETHLPESGVYWFPPMPTNPGLDADAEKKAIYTKAREEAMKAQQEGPVGILFYHADGINPM